MKILDLKSYSEKQNVTKINLSDLDKIEIPESDRPILTDASFDKDSLVLGQVVMFSDKGFGVYVPFKETAIIKLVKKHIKPNNISQQ